MARLSLDGDWQLRYFPEGEHRIGHPDDLAGAGLKAIPARVPGNVELDLERAGLLPDPFYAGNIRQLRPLEICEWWYTRDFELPPEAGGGNWDLVLAGADALATVWVNGVEVGRSDNMLVEHRYDVTAALRQGQANRIAVRLGSPLNYARGFQYDAATSGADGRYEGLYIRKAPHMWGWDIMPRAVSAGLWRSVWLEPRPPTAIEQVYYWTAGIDAGGAVLGVHFQFRTDDPIVDGCAMRFRGVCGEHAFEFEWPCEFVADGCYIRVPGARLWWPKGCGGPNLYAVTAQLSKGGQVLDERSERIGIRKLVVDRTELAGAAEAAGPATHGTARVDTPPDPESHFVFYVNDEPIMVKGSNYVPLDAFHSRDAERVERAVAEGECCVPANQNWQVSRIRSYASDQKVYLMRWELDGQAYGNHYLAGQPPLPLSRYRQWLPAIAALPRPFDPGAVAR